MDLPLTSDHIQIKIKLPNPNKEPPVPSKAPNEDLKDMDVRCTFKIKLENQNLDHGCIKEQWPYPNQDQDAKPQSETNVLQTLNQYFKNMKVLCTIKIKIESQNLEQGCIKD